jgi:NPCBM/NEW2 domain
VSDLTWAAATNGWGPAERDRSNGEQAAGDGRTLGLRGTLYAKGVGVHAGSDITVNLGGQYATFLSDVGVDDETFGQGSVIFQVFVDGVKAYDSGVVTGTSAARPVSVDVTGKTTLRLVVTDAGNGNALDHGDWASARLTPASTSSNPAPTLTSLAPSAATVGGAGFTLTVNGTGFASGATVRWNGSSKTTTFKSATAVTAAIAAGDIATVGTTPITVVNPGSAASNALSFSIASSAPSSPPPPGSATFLSNLTWTSATNGWGPVERDRSNGEQAAGDGRTMSVRGNPYSKGLGVHAASDISFNLGGQYSTFLTDVGLDDETGGQGSVTFQVFVDGSKLYDSGVVTGTSAVKSVNVNVAGKSTLRLVVTDAGDGNAFDHADWANARLTTP